MEKHHYIPQFFIKGFTDEKGFVWVYDKTSDSVLRQQKHPRNIFYENDYNSIDFFGVSIPLIEGLYSGLKGYKGFRGFDDKSSNIIKNFQYSKINYDIFKSEMMWNMIEFIAQLTYRIPCNEKLNQIAISNFLKSKPELDHVISNLSWMNDNDRFKFHRFTTPSLFFYEASKFRLNESLSYKIIEWDNDVFCLTDNPIIWRSFPMKPVDFHSPLVFPITKNRLFILSQKSIENYSLTSREISLIIKIQMTNSNKYVAFSDKEKLMSYVSDYRSTFKGINVNNTLTQLLFENI